jgi:hypothetical protein
MITITVSGNSPEEIKSGVSWLASQLCASEFLAETKMHLAAEAAQKVEAVVESAKTTTKAVKEAKVKAAKTVEPDTVLADPPTPTEPPSPAPTESLVIPSNTADLIAETQDACKAASARVSADTVRDTVFKIAGVKHVAKASPEMLPVIKAAVEAL